MGLFLAIALAAGLTQDPGRAEPPAPVLAGCKTCKLRGVTDCPEHEEDLRILERTVRCSQAAACQKCAGALVVDCPKCEGGPETAPAEARRADLAAWRATGKLPVEELLGREVLRVESEHVHLAAEIGTLRDGKKKVDGHRFLHVLSRDAEAVATLLNAHYSVERERDYKAPMRLWFWQSLDVHVKVMREQLKVSGAGDVKILGRKPQFSVCTSDQSFQDEYVVLLTLGVHNLSHMLQSNLWDEIWIGDQGAGWFDAGAAHWYEEKLYGRSRHFCIDEAGSPPSWEDGVWRSAIKALLQKREAVIFPDLLKKQTGEMTPEEHALAWSIYDWLVATHPDALVPILKASKAKKPARELLPETMGMGILDAEKRWREWVEETYPGREKKPKD
jgi:hypothetical protein